MSDERNQQEVVDRPHRRTRFLATRRKQALAAGTLGAEIQSGRL